MGSALEPQRVQAAEIQALKEQNSTLVEVLDQMRSSASAVCAALKVLKAAGKDNFKLRRFTCYQPANR